MSMTNAPSLRGKYADTLFLLGLRPGRRFATVRNGA
jgi:hypothetical protein